ETDNVGKGPKPPAGPREVTSQPTNVGKGKTPTDLFALIPIAQAELFEAARAAGINRKYTREFLSSLIADKRIAVQKIRREKAKGGIARKFKIDGCRGRYARRVMIAEKLRNAPITILGNKHEA